MHWFRALEREEGKREERTQLGSGRFGATVLKRKHGSGKDESRVSRTKLDGPKGSEGWVEIPMDSGRVKVRDSWSTVLSTELPFSPVSERRGRVASSRRKTYCENPLGGSVATLPVGVRRSRFLREERLAVRLSKALPLVPARRSVHRRLKGKSLRVTPSNSAGSGRKGISQSILAAKTPFSKLVKRLGSVTLVAGTESPVKATYFGKLKNRRTCAEFKCGVPGRGQQGRGAAFVGTCRHGPGGGSLQEHRNRICIHRSFGCFGTEVMVMRFGEMQRACSAAQVSSGNVVCSPHCFIMGWGCPCPKFEGFHVGSSSVNPTRWEKRRVWFAEHVAKYLSGGRNDRDFEKYVRDTTVLFRKFRWGAYSQAIHLGWSTYMGKRHEDSGGWNRVACRKLFSWKSKQRLRRCVKTERRHKRESVKNKPSAIRSGELTLSVIG
jgi:hypothetical protein